MVLATFLDTMSAIIPTYGMLEPTPVVDRENSTPNFTNNIHVCYMFNEFKLQCLL